MADWLDPAAKLLSVVVVVVYLTGFLVVSWHLSKFGVSSLSVIQLDYLVAGLWVVLPPLFTQLVSFNRDIFREHLVNQGRKVHWAPEFLSDIILSFPSNFIMSALFIGPLVITLRRYKVLLGLFLLAGTGLCSALFVSSLLAPADEKRSLVARKLARPYGGLSLALYFLYAWFFAVNVYPVIPFEWGGGKPITVEFLEGEKPFPDGIMKDGTSKHSVKYKLLAMTDKSYVVLSTDSNQKSMQFNHDVVNGIIVVNDEKPK